MQNQFGIDVDMKIRTQQEHQKNKQTNKKHDLTDFG
jgi:hypothetical protein